MDMAVQTKSYRKRTTAARNRQTTQTIRESVKSSLVRFLPGWILIAFVLVILLPNALTATLGAAGRAITQLPQSVGIAPSSGSIAPIFTSTIDYWSVHIAQWAARYDVDPNLLATIMQIESCGDSTVSSYAGAQGLFQVMPFHFETGENQLDPDTNAMRGANFINQCLGWAEGNAGLALACYNGGPSVLNKSFAAWPAQTQRYYNWGTTIYQDAVENKQSSDSLQNWLDAGGSSLCHRAANTLGISG
jgi:soluble lytic murein transglycosylase-like protein